MGIRVRLGVVMSAICVLFAGWSTSAAQASAGGSGTHRVDDIYAGARPSDPGLLTSTNGTIFFSAHDGVHGRELWRSDGTKRATTMVADINPGPGSSAISFFGSLATVRDTLLFAATDGQHGRELWRSDGSAAGTYMVKDINAGGEESAPWQWGCLDDTLLFGANDGESGNELWRSDGTADGTVMVKDINALGPSYPLDITAVRGVALFTADDGVHGRELWRSDGTAGGTYLVADIVPGPVALPGPSFLTVAGDVLYFQARGGLWRSDGTTAGTFIVKDVSPGSMTALGDTVFFGADDGSGRGTELWRSDGTTAGTYMVKDIRPGEESSISFVAQQAAAGEQLFFRADDGVHGAELWRTDGTAEGTSMVADINVGPASSILFGTEDAVVGDVLFFAANDGIHGRELWRSDGTRDGTGLVRDLHPSTDPTRYDTGPRYLTAAGDLLFFSADDTEKGRELWLARP